jgi:hypothetical protein
MSRMKDQRRAKSQKDKRRPLKAASQTLEIDEQDILEEIDLDRRMLELES